MIDTNPYSSGFLDRAAELRDSADSLAARLAHADTAFLPVWRMKNYIYAANGQAETGQATGPSMAIVPAVRWREHVTCPTDEHIFLGLRDGVAYFTADISHIEAPDRHPALTGPGTFEDLRQIGPLLEPADASLLAYARGIVYWHTRHRFCGECGSPTKVKSSGHRRQCTNEMCVAEQFPRTDPAVIMLVHDTDRIIMGRSPRFPPGMHSVLAGFLEPGESLEDAVAREVREEVGVAVTDIHYHSSQP
ncbi:MAG: NUDIX domain-containing protein, partial [Alphaproteobacteria bacterium]|nr:NUDIX domain-containing protein [Alphaproteobacteria bacterium]